MTPFQRLRSDLSRARSYLIHLKAKDRDNLLALEAARVEVRRAEQSLKEWIEAPELETLRGIVRGERTV